MGRADHAAVAHERAHGRAQVLQFADRVLARRRLLKAAPVAQSFETVERPIEDAGQLGAQLGGEGPDSRARRTNAS